MKKSTRIVLIGGNLIGLVCLNEIFETLYKSKNHPDKKIQEKLLSLVQQENYIPPGQKSLYAQALYREYSLYYQKKISGLRIDARMSYGTYQGIPRENIPWYPTVFDEKCDGCKKCYDMCPQKVYYWDDKNSKPKVINPFVCVVGCSECAEICKPKAISFPPLSILDSFKSD